MRLIRYALPLFLLFLSCSSETTRPQTQQPPQLATNDSPGGAIARFVGTYELKYRTEFTAMLTGDYNFQFSNDTDPDLIAKYPSGWAKTDEDLSAAHLFAGFTPPGQSFAPAASAIDINFVTTSIVPDTTTGVDVVTHKMLVTAINGTIVIPPSPPATDPTNYQFEDNANVLFLVRGDVAVGLEATQPADTTHWYVRRWIDASTVFAPHSLLPPQVTSWAGIRANYR